MKKEQIKKLLKEEWYIQSGNLTPIYLLSAALSAFRMKKDLGVDFSVMLFASRHEEGDLYYRVKDLWRMHSYFMKKFEHNPNYFAEKKRVYEKSVRVSQRFLKSITPSLLRRADIDTLLSLVRKGIDTVTESVGIAHCIESISIPSDTIFRKELEKYVSDADKLNVVFAELTTPPRISLLHQAEKFLFSVSVLDGKKQERQAKEYIKRFGWMHNTYAGVTPYSVPGVIEDAKKLAHEGGYKPMAPSNKTDIYTRMYRIPRPFARKLKLLGFLSVWQDERKRNILISVGYLEQILQEISERFSFPLPLLRYALLETDFSRSLLKSQKKLSQRRNGSFYVATHEGIRIFTGSDYSTFQKLLQHDISGTKDTLTGMTASSGKATGVVRVCGTPASLSKMEKGDILVTSMTRPEYLPAMKKAAAIVTDEGGITSHAAIVSRELKKPCIIGTKIATKVLKDGDVVEVNADAGVVRIISPHK